MMEKLQSHEQKINDMNKIISDIIKSNAEKNAAEQQEKIQKYLLELNSKNFEKAQTYTNFIIYAGYAGGFAIFNYNKSFFSVKLNILISILLGLS